MGTPADRTVAVMELPETQLQLLAQLLARELGSIYGLEPALLTAAEVARRYGVTRAWVYKHAGELGGQRMGSGPKARLRFRQIEVRRRLGAEDRAASAPASRAGAVELLPVGARRLSRR
jgi:hypothetical protein